MHLAESLDAVANSLSVGQAPFGDGIEKTSSMAFEKSEKLVDVIYDGKNTGTDGGPQIWEGARGTGHYRPAKDGGSIVRVIVPAKNNEIRELALRTFTGTAQSPRGGLVRYENGNKSVQVPDSVHKMPKLQDVVNSLASGIYKYFMDGKGKGTLINKESLTTLIMRLREGNRKGLQPHLSEIRYKRPLHSSEFAKMVFSILKQWSPRISEDIVVSEQELKDLNAILDYDWVSYGNREDYLRGVYHSEGYQMGLRGWALDHYVDEQLGARMGDAVSGGHDDPASQYERSLRNMYVDEKAYAKSKRPWSLYG
jgi:hypothetical protein